jgi:hypothetical protein
LRATCIINNISEYLFINIDDFFHGAETVKSLRFRTF